MGRSTDIYEMQQPEKLKDLLKQDQSKYDCLSCRVMGGGAFIGLGAYSYWSGQTQLNVRQAEIARRGSRFGIAARRTGITGLSGLLVGMGLYRLFA